MCAKMRGVDDASFAPQGEGACVVIGLVAIASSNEAFAFRRAVNQIFWGLFMKRIGRRKVTLNFARVVSLIDETP